MHTFASAIFVFCLSASLSCTLSKRPFLASPDTAVIRYAHTNARKPPSRFPDTRRYTRSCYSRWYIVTGWSHRKREAGKYIFFKG